MFRKKKNNERKSTAGEIVFDRVVYTGIGFALNEALAMLLAVEMRHFGGKAKYLEASKWWQRTMGFKDKRMNGEIISGLERAGDSLEIFTLLGSGTALVVPMKLMEDRKHKIVQNLNHAMDKLSGRQLDAEALRTRDEEVEKALACEPKQTWGSMILGRAIATVNNMFLLKETVFAGSRTKKVKNWSEKYMGLAADKLNAVTGGRSDSAIARMRRTERFQRYTEIFGLETLYTFASSAVLEISSKFIASKKPAVKNPELCEKVEEEEARSIVQAKDKEATPGSKKFSEKVESRKKEEPMVSYTQKVTDQPNQPAQPAL